MKNLEIKFNINLDEIDSDSRKLILSIEKIYENCSEQGDNLMEILKKAENEPEKYDKIIHFIEELRKIEETFIKYRETVYKQIAEEYKSIK